MNRRGFMTAVSVVGATAIAGCTEAASRSETETPIKTVTDPPDAVEAVLPLTKAFAAHIDNYYPDARVFPLKSGEIAMEYTTDAETAEALRTEFNQIAVEFVTVVREGDFPPTTFTMVTAKVQAILAEPVVEQFSTGPFDAKAKEGLGKTLGVTSIERRTDA